MKRSQEFSPSGLTPSSKSQQTIQKFPTTTARALFPPRKEGGAQPASRALLPPEWSRQEEEALLVHMSRQVEAGIISGWPAPRSQGENFWLKASEAVYAVNRELQRSG